MEQSQIEKVKRSIENLRNKNFRQKSTQEA